MTTERTASTPGWLPVLLRDAFGVDVPSHDGATVTRVLAAGAQ